MDALRILLILLGLSLSASSSAKVWIIHEDGSGDAPTIQAGIDSASSGDEIVLDPGTYYEQILIRDKSIRLKSSHGPLSTVVDGSLAEGSIISVVSERASGTIIEGLTITNGRGSKELPGGGFYIYDAEPVIRNNIIKDNKSSYDSGSFATGAGGGIFIASEAWQPSKTVLIVGNEIVDNYSEIQGGGIFSLNDTSPHIINNTIARNIVNRGDGGGISLLLVSDGTIVKGNIIVENRAGDHGGGVMISLATNLRGPLEVEISDNIIASNVGGEKGPSNACGGGLWLQRTNVRGYENTIVLNGCSRGRLGGNVAFMAEGSPSFERNIVGFALAGGGIYCSAESVPTIRDNLGWSNGGGNVVGDCPTWGSDNIEADPEFCNLEAQDYSLAVGSPALVHPSGPLGAVAESGCSEKVLVRSATWGFLKSLYR